LNLETHIYGTLARTVNIQVWLQVILTKAY